jgi:molybdenum cofactor guanylyltransferase
MTAAVILAGGQGRRMGGRDKALLILGGRPLIAHVRARLARQAGPLAVSANGDAARFARFGLPVLHDAVPGGGPLSGILAGLDWVARAGGAQLLTAAVDTPFLPLDLRDRLAAAGGTGLALAATSGPDGAPRLQPAFGLWPVSLRDDLRLALAGRGLDTPAPSIRAFAARHGAATALFPPARPDPFFNLNTPADLAAAALHMAGA